MAKPKKRILSKGNTVKRVTSKPTKSSPNMATIGKDTKNMCSRCGAPCQTELCGVCRQAKLLKATNIGYRVGAREDSKNNCVRCGTQLKIGQSRYCHTCQAVALASGKVKVVKKAIVPIMEHKPMLSDSEKLLKAQNIVANSHKYPQWLVNNSYDIIAKAHKI